jgi:hypothetical protein
VADVGSGVSVAYLNVGHDVGDYPTDLGCQSAMTKGRVVGENGDSDV